MNSSAYAAKGGKIAIRVTTASSILWGVHEVTCMCMCLSFACNYALTEKAYTFLQAG